MKLTTHMGQREEADTIRDIYFEGVHGQRCTLFVFQLNKDILPKLPDFKLAQPLLFKLSKQFHPWGGIGAWNDMIWSKRTIFRKL